MISDFLALLGSLCFLIASIGLLRLPDSFARIHGATKASALGILLFVIATIIRFPSFDQIFLALMSLILVFLTAPLACQAIASRLITTTKKPKP